MLKRISDLKLLAAIVVIYVVGTIIARRRGYGGWAAAPWFAVARVTSTRRSGFRELLVLLRLGWWRLQWCPVGRHWSLVAPVKDSELTEEDRLLAEQYRDAQLP